MAMTVDACKVFLVGKSARKLSLRRKACPYGLNAADSTLPRKSSKESFGYPYRKPTQVVEEKILRRE